MAKKTHSKKRVTCFFVAITVVLTGFVYWCIAPNCKIDNVLLQKSDSLVNEYPKIINSYLSFQRNASIDMYEYTDTISYEDTFMFYYFCYHENYYEKWNTVSKSAAKYVAEFDAFINNLDEIVNNIYFYSLVINKYGLPILDDFSQKINEIGSIIVSQSNIDIYLLNNLWKLKKSAELLNVNFFISDLSEIAKNVVVENNDLLSQLSQKSITGVLSGRESDALQVLNELLISFSMKEIDIESLIIFLNVFPEEYLHALPRPLVEEIFVYCTEKYYDLAPYISFIGCKICEMYDKSFLEHIQKIYADKPVDESGFVPTVAMIIPTFRRLFQYSEVCHVLGISLDKATLYEVASTIDNDKLMVEDYYYMSLLSRCYQDISIDNAQLKKLILKAGSIEISYSNLFSFYYLVKAAFINDIDATDLVSKINRFMVSNSEDYLIADIWSLEIDYLLYGKPINYEDLDKRVLEYSGDLDISVYYQYMLLLQNSDNKCSDAIKQRIKEAINNHYIENNSGGGFWRNPTFKYVDIAATYECLFLKYFCE